MIRAGHDPKLDVRIAGSKALHYDEGADATLDRPAHVRAGSGIVVAYGAAWVIQDDAHFLGRVDLATAAVAAITLPAGPGGLRQFDPVRGNKPEKMDLECLIALGSKRLGLLALGSGSTAKRRAMLQIGLAGEPQTTLIDARAFYDALEREKEFSGSELNVEGAVLYEEARLFRLRLFQRGNGAPKDKLLPVNATCEVPLADALAGRAPAIENIRRYDLGAVDGVALSFTDAAWHEGACWYLAAAEDSPDTYADGPTTGVVLGRIDPASGAAKHGRIFEADGKPCVRKLEGLAFDAAKNRWLAVEDKDDPTKACELVWIP